jgi:DivIVA domain-containing protein
MAHVGGCRYAVDPVAPEEVSPAVRLSPEEIEARRFRLAPNGYDCEAVDRFLAEITEALREQAATAAGSDEFSRVGHEIAAVLRAARDSAGAVKAEAEGHAAAARSRAELEADDVRKQAKAQLIEAQETLSEAKERAEAVVREAEENAQAIHHAERVARQRLLATRTDLQNQIDRLGGSGSGRPVLDLTSVSPEPDPDGGGSDPTEASADEGTEGAGDPLLRMVRAAVGRAAEHSTADDAAALEQQAPAV